MEAGIPLLPSDELDLDNEQPDDMTSPRGLHDFACGVSTRENLVRNYFEVQ